MIKNIYIYVAEPALNGSIELRVWADAPSYEDAAANYDDLSELVTIVNNYIGPVLIIKLLNNDYFYIYLLNCLIFIISYFILSKDANIDSSKLLVYLIINPMLFISLMSVNKEIVSLLFIALLISYLKNKKLTYLVLCFFVSFIVRWQLTLFLLIYLALTSPLINIYRFKTLCIFVLIISAAYIFISQELGVFEDTANLFADIDTRGSGLFVLLNKVQATYGYYIVVVPKTFQNLFGGITRISSMFDWSDFYNNFIVLWQSIYLSVTAALLVIRRKFDMNNDIFYLAVVYCALFAISPIIQIRYFFVISIIFAVLLSDDTKRSNEQLIDEKL
jgi:hypothetical protein